MAKHMRNGGDGDVVGNAALSAFPLDAAGWAQAVLMAAPALGYALIYYARWQKYVWLGVSPSLITVHLEDVLLVIVLTVIVGWAHLINWIQILLDSNNWRVKASRILCPLLIALIVFQVNAIHTEVVDVGICNWSVIDTRFRRSDRFLRLRMRTVG